MKTSDLTWKLCTVTLHSKIQQRKYIYIEDNTIELLTVAKEHVMSLEENRFSFCCYPQSMKEPM